MSGPRIDRRAVILGGLAAGLAGPIRADGAPGKNPRPEVAFEIPPQDPRVGRLVAQVSQANLRDSIAGLTGFPTRWSGSARFSEVEAWVAARFAAHGGAAWRQAFALPSGQRRNNVLTGDPGAGTGVILVGAHVDSTSEQPGVSAPGANDNASGMAALLEAQRILADVPMAREVVFAAFAGEEQGLVGSTALAAEAARAGWPIDLMVNLDMIGFRPPDPGDPIFIEYDRGNATGTNDAASRAYGELAAQLAAQHTRLPTAHANIEDSDYMPFEEAGFPCIGFYDGGVAGPEYHRSTDVADLLAFDRIEQVTRMLVALLATVGIMD